MKLQMSSCSTTARRCSDGGLAEILICQSPRRHRHPPELWRPDEPPPRLKPLANCPIIFPDSLILSLRLFSLRPPNLPFLPTPGPGLQRRMPARSMTRVALIGCAGASGGLTIFFATSWGMMSKSISRSRFNSDPKSRRSRHRTL